MNADKLKIKMMENGHGRRDLAKILKIAYWTVCQKMNNKYPFKQREIQIITREYKLTSEEVNEIFFNEI